MAQPGKSSFHDPALGDYLKLTFFSSRFLRDRESQFQFFADKSFRCTPIAGITRKGLEGGITLHGDFQNRTGGLYPAVWKSINLLKIKIKTCNYFGSSLEQGPRDQGSLHATGLALKGLTPATAQDIMSRLTHSGDSETLPASGRVPVQLRTASRCRTAQETRAATSPAEIGCDSSV